MSKMKWYVAFSVASAMSVMGSTRAFAEPPLFDSNVNKTTTMTFTKPIRIPGVTLAAGTYVFMHPDVAGESHLVRILSQDQKKVYATLHTMPNERITPAKETIITFRETPAGSTDTIKAWFYPGESTGDEFMYSKAEATKIAKATHESVLTQPGTTRINWDGKSEAFARATTGSLPYPDDQITKRINELQSAAIVAAGQGELPDAAREIIVKFSMRADLTLAAASADWRTSVRQAWMELKRQLPPIASPAVSKAIDSVDIVLIPR